MSVSWRRYCSATAGSCSDRRHCKSWYSGAGDFLQQAEKAALARRRDRPVDGQRLEAILEALADTAVVEEAPARAAVDGSHEMVVGLVEVVVVVFVVDDGLAAIAGRGAPARDLQADAVRAGLQGSI